MNKLLLTLCLGTLSFVMYGQTTNDECANAIAIPVNGGILCNQNTSVDFTGSTPSAEAGACAGSDDIWFHFTATQTGHKIMASVSVPHEFTLYSGTCGSLTEITCGSTGTGNLTNLTVGQSYFLRIYENVLENINEICIISPPTYIDVDNTYTAQQLVEDVLISSDCLEISNISGTSVEGFTGMAYFEKGFSNFHFESGIVLSTGNTDNLTAMPFISSSDNGNAGDEDLAEVIVNDGVELYDNASVLEFDFVPLIDEISFDFIFASNEYGVFQCFWADAFAFILTDTSTGVITNLAVLPDTDIPVSVTTVRDNAYNGACESQNEEFFDEFYGADNPLAPFNMLGCTVPLTAQSSVVPGNVYHIKLVIADFGDDALDAAVFIDAGSFNIGSPDNTIVELEASNGNLLCNGESTTLSIGLEGDYTFTWKKDGELIVDATGNAITVDEAGIYTLTVDLPQITGCTVEYSMTVITGEWDFEGNVQVTDYLAYEQNSDGIYTFDLAEKSQEIEDITGANGYTITYHESLPDAENDLNALPTNYTNIANPQTIYVRMENSNGSCFVTTSFSLAVVNENLVTPPPVAPFGGDFTFQEGDTLADIPMEGENIQWYDNPGEGNPNGMGNDTPLPMTTLLVDGMTYYATQTVDGIESIERTPVTVRSALGLEETVFAGLNIYPNPVQEKLSISNQNTIESVTVSNLLGQQVLYKVANATDLQIDLSALQQGVYLIKIASEGKEKTMKIVKK